MQNNYGFLEQIRLSPVFRLWLIEEPPPAGWNPLLGHGTVVTSDAIQLGFPEQESNVSLTPITRRTMFGGDRQIGLTLTHTHYTSVRPEADFHTDLAKYSGRRVSAKIQFGGYRRTGAFGLGELPEFPGYIERFLYLTKLGDIDARVEMNWRVEPAEFRQRHVITLQARLPLTGYAGLLWSEDASWW